MAVTSESPTALDENTLVDVAYWRSRGLSWDDAAAKLQRQPAELRRAARSDPRYRRELAYAKREYKHETEAQALQALRVQLKSDDPRAALSAAKSILTHLSRKRTERIKFKIACIRAEVDPPGGVKPVRAEVPPPLEADGRLNSEKPSAGRVSTTSSPAPKPDKGPFLKSPGVKPNAVSATSKPYDDAPPG